MLQKCPEVVMSLKSSMLQIYSWSPRAYSARAPAQINESFCWSKDTSANSGKVHKHKQTLITSSCSLEINKARGWLGRGDVRGVCPPSPQHLRLAKGQQQFLASRINLAFSCHDPGGQEMLVSSQICPIAVTNCSHWH